MDPKNPSKKNLAILFGGVSPEHEVSIITGIQVATNADAEKYSVIPVYVSKSGQWYTGNRLLDVDVYKNLDGVPYVSQSVSLNIDKPKHLIINHGGLFKRKSKIKLDVVFPCFHGGVGESGPMQGLLELSDLPYVGSDVLGSSLGMDKVVMKQVLEQSKIKVAPYMHFYKKRWKYERATILDELEQALKYPMFVKPANAGSSIGISKVTTKEGLDNAIDVAFTFDRKVIVETGIEGFKEINVSVIGIAGEELIASECEEVFTSKDFLNYEDKYVGEGGKSKGMASAKRMLPTSIAPESKDILQTVAKKAFTALNASGLSRVDFLFNESTSEYCLIEINTIPGSMAFYLWEKTDLKFKDLVDKLVDTALHAHQLKSDKTTSFSSTS